LREGLKNRLVEVKLRRKEEGAGARPVNIDGKTIRGSGFHMVSAWIEEHGLTLGQLKTEEKSNEIKAAPKLLELLDVRGDVITADAMDCRKDIAQKIREQGADYILAVKENQPTLYGDIKEYFEGMESGDFTAEEFLNYIRGHWSIENQLHWMLDKSLSGRRVSGKDGECGPQFEYTEKDGVTPAEENKNGEETGQRQTPHDARRPGFGLPV
jgi:predicted transposase YbfD/YdcC